MPTAPTGGLNGRAATGIAPACQHQRSRDWLQRQRRSLLPVRYFHWVFTLPATLRAVVLGRTQPRSISCFSESASATLLQLGQERFQAELGLTAILHTWGQNLMNHPHLHCLVTGGGLTAQNTWAGPKQARWLFPVHAVAKMFQGKFCAAPLQLHTTGKLQFLERAAAPLKPPLPSPHCCAKMRSKRCILFAKGSVVGPDHVLDYLGRYTHRVALSNSRLRAIDLNARTVTFTYKDYADASRIKPLPLTGVEFIRRFLLHLLPPGFTKIRDYGSTWQQSPKPACAPGTNRLGNFTAALLPKAPPASRHSPSLLPSSAHTAKVLNCVASDGPIAGATLTLFTHAILLAGAFRFTLTRQLLSTMTDLLTHPAKTAAPFLRTNGRTQALPSCTSQHPCAPNRLTPNPQTLLIGEPINAGSQSELWPIPSQESNVRLLLL